MTVLFSWIIAGEGILNLIFMAAEPTGDYMKYEVLFNLIMIVYGVLTDLQIAGNNLFLRII